MASRGTEIAYHDRGNWNTQPKTLRVIFETVDDQCANVRRADNNRLLGSVYRPTRRTGGNWTAYIADGAFRGDSVDDEGYILDTVPDRLTKRGPAWCTITQSTRRGAVELMLTSMSRDRPPALGYGRHPDVARRHDDDPQRRERFMRTGD